MANSMCSGISIGYATTNTLLDTGSSVAKGSKVKQEIGSSLYSWYIRCTSHSSLKASYSWKSRPAIGRTYSWLNNITLFSQGDVTTLKPSVMCAVPLVLDRIYKGLQVRISKASGIHNSQMFEGRKRRCSGTDMLIIIPSISIMNFI